LGFINYNGHLEVHNSLLNGGPLVGEGEFVLTGSLRLSLHLLELKYKPSARRPGDGGVEGVVANRP
jgi:hypothetical protein